MRNDAPYYPRATAEDELDRIFGAPSTPRAAEPVTEPSMDAAEEQATTAVPVKLDRTSPFYKACTKCNGRGWIASNRTGRNIGSCFKCKGAGGVMLKTTTDERNRSAANAKARAERAVEANIEAFRVQYPEELASIEAGKARGFEFAIAMLQAIGHYGHLTERQLAAVQRGVERDKEHAARKAAEAKAEAERAPIIADKLVAAFEAARDRGLVRPILRFEGFSISPAKATSANAGALYVKDGGVYLGKIVGTEFKASWDGKQRKDLADRISSIMADPVEAAKQYGKESGICSCCGRTLTDPASIAAGIGPICAEGWGF